MISDPKYWVFYLVRTFFYYAWWIPFHVPFFFWDFTFGHVIYGGLIICLSVSIIHKLLLKGKYQKVR